MTLDVVIAGGGIGGAVLADALGRGGKHVLVLEKGTAPPTWIRPEILWPITVEYLFSLAPQAAWEAEALLPMRGMALRDGPRTLLSVTREELAATGVQPWLTNPNQSRAQLLRLGTFEARRGVEVLSVLKEQGQVVGVRARDVATGTEEEVLARYTIGDDGVHSLVRQACGIPISLRLFPVDLLCFDFDWPIGLVEATVQTWINWRRLVSGVWAVALFPLPRGRGAGLVAVRPRVFDGLAAAQEALATLCATDPLLQGVMGARELARDFVRVRRPWGHTPRYGTAGAFLIGDAAHPVSPIAAQGANMAVADARVLADLLLNNHPQPLDAYQHRRRPSNEQSVRFTRAAALLLGVPDSIVRWLPASLVPEVMGTIRPHPLVLRRVFQGAATAFG